MDMTVLDALGIILVCWAILFPFALVVAIVYARQAWSTETDSDRGLFILMTSLFWPGVVIRIVFHWIFDKPFPAFLKWLGRIGRTKW